MMKSLFYTLSFIPKPLFSYFVDIYLFFKIFKLFTSYKITKVNLEIAFPEAKMKEIELMSKLSIRESIISGYETIYTWGRRDFDSNNHIFKIENNFLLNSLTKQDQGLIAVTFHNRSVDMLLKWINSQVKTLAYTRKLKLNSLVILLRKIERRRALKLLKLQ